MKKQILNGLGYVVAVFSTLLFFSLPAYEDRPSELLGYGVLWILTVVATAWLCCYGKEGK